MKILAVADTEAKYYYDYYTGDRLKEFDLILACGDLPRAYLEFLVTMARCPLVYVCGNHDARFENEPPEGCICADDQIIEVNGVRILGLGGSYRYRPGPCMYSEKQMRRRILKLLPKLWRKKGFDILLTHAPAYDLNDLDTIPHRGFECFHWLLEKWKPKYFIHGHIHLTYGVNLPRGMKAGETTVVNAYEYWKFEY